ncbi:hypothetical protein EJB05_13774, partial [Eragrostis curvula]
MAMAELAGKEQELRTSKDDIARLKQELHIARQERELQSSKQEELVQLKLELQVAREDRAATEAHVKELQKDVARLSEELRMEKQAYVKQLKKANEQHSADFVRLSKELRMAKEAHVKELEKANTAHSADVARLGKELRMAKEAHAKQLETVKAEHEADSRVSFSGQQPRYIKGLRGMRKLAIDMYPDVVDPLKLNHQLLSKNGNNLAGGLQGTASKAPAEDQ